VIAQSSRVRPTKRPGADGGGNVSLPLFLHVCPSFEVGGLQDRTVAILNHLGPKARHAIIALDGNYACARRLDANISLEVSDGTWTGAGPIKSFWSSFQALGVWRPDLYLTYNWASLEWAAANLFRHSCPHIHHEDGFGPEESVRQLTRRILFRRLALLRSSALVVPSQSLYRLARETWRISPRLLNYIPNGIECGRFRAARRKVETAPGPGELVLGSIAPLRPEKGLDVLLRLAADLSQDHAFKLLIAGDGPERQKLEALADELGLRPRVEFLGQIDGVAEILSRINVFVLTSMTEQMPFSVLQAMAAERAVAAYDVGDLKEMVAENNRPFVVARGDQRALHQAMIGLMENRELRLAIGAANARKVEEDYPQSAMLAAHENLYAALLPTKYRSGFRQPCL
jgi:glycosyltransferase involved in cell wall biosynthesis